MRDLIKDLIKEKDAKKDLKKDSNVTFDKNCIYIITGVFGHLGNTLAHTLLKNGCEVRGLALPNENAVELAGNLTVIRGNVLDVNSLSPLFANTNQKEVIVIHTAGIVTISSKFKQNVFDVNVTGTKNMLEISKANNVKKFVYISSVHAIPADNISDTLSEISDFDPDLVTGLYAKTKAEATALVLSYAKNGLNACVVHPSGIIGPYDYGHGHITQLIIDYLNGSLTACVKGGYDFVDVRDVVNGTLSAIDKGKTGDCYILSNRFITIEELLKTLHVLSGKRQIKTVLPLWFARLTAPLSEIYYKIRKEPPLYTKYSLYTLQCNSDFSNKRARDVLGYKPRPLEETLQDTIDFLKRIKRVKA